MKYAYGERIDCVEDMPKNQFSNVYRCEICGGPVLKGARVLTCQACREKQAGAKTPEQGTVPMKVRWVDARYGSIQLWMGNMQLGSLSYGLHDEGYVARSAFGCAIKSDGTEDGAKAALVDALRHLANQILDALKEE